MKELIKNYKAELSKKTYLEEAVASIVFVSASIIMQYYAILYATKSASNAVTDIILSNVRVFDIDWIFVFATVFVASFTIIVLIIRPARMPFALKSLSVFIIIRSIFIILTHIGPFPNETERTSYEFVNKLLFGSDSFFSGHTGMPYLGALVFWKDEIIRYLFIISSVAFAVIVLLGHIHYSIDVLAAYFITYSIFKISEYLFHV